MLRHGRLVLQGQSTWLVLNPYPPSSVAVDKKSGKVVFRESVQVAIIAYITTTTTVASDQVVLCCTTEAAEAASVLCCTTEAAEAASVFCCTTEAAEAASVLCCTTEAAEAASVFCCTTEAAEAASVYCCTTEAAEAASLPSSDASSLGLLAGFLLAPSVYTAVVGAGAGSKKYAVAKTPAVKQMGTASGSRKGQRSSNGPMGRSRSQGYLMVG